MLTPNDVRSIQACVNDLEYVLKNWDYFASCDPNGRIILDAGDTAREVFDVDMGLCDNVFSPNDLSGHIKLRMFIAWDDFSGDAMYPVGGLDEYDGCESGNLYQNCKRKALALHCVEYLNRLLELN